MPSLNAKTAKPARLDISRVHVLDGGMATELERRGCNISGPLWSAHVLDVSPDTVHQVHLDYLRAGADCISTVSYQVSSLGYAEIGRSAKSADHALRRAVDIADSARREYAQESSRAVLIAASLGPYGAALHNGAEFHGHYNISYDELMQFHAERLAVIVQTSADIVALETIPSLEEAQAILQALAQFPSLQAWLSFTCKDHSHVAHGEPVAECAALAGKSSQIVAVGINCTQPALIKPLIQQAKSSKPIFVYPNSGEAWDPTVRKWFGDSDPADYKTQALEWFAAGAQAVGGCCRTTRAHIQSVRAAWQEFEPSGMRQ